MKYASIGKNGLITMIFGEQSNSSTPQKEALKIIDHYLAAGGNHIDTADVYAGGRSEEIVGRPDQRWES